MEAPIINKDSIKTAMNVSYNTRRIFGTFLTSSKISGDLDPENVVYVKAVSAAKMMIKLNEVDSFNLLSQLDTIEFIANKVCETIIEACDDVKLSKTGSIGYAYAIVYACIGQDFYAGRFKKHDKDGNESLSSEELDKINKESTNYSTALTIPGKSFARAVSTTSAISTPPTIAALIGGSSSPVPMIPSISPVTAPIATPKPKTKITVNIADFLKSRKSIFSFLRSKGAINLKCEIIKSINLSNEDEAMFEVADIIALAEIGVIA